MVPAGLVEEPAPMLAGRAGLALAAPKPSAQQAHTADVLAEVLWAESLDGATR
jgi:hypothetical protein